MDTPHECSSCDGWNEPVAPFRIHGNTWYVGTAGLSALLVVGKHRDGRDALVLLDGALTQSAPLIARNIESLGHSLDDIEVILNSHTHFDHAGGIAALQRASGARVVASAQAAGALRTGQVDAHDPQAGYAPANGFPPVENVETLADGGVLDVGDLALTLNWTPGHAPGSTSWSWRSCEDGACINVIYVDSMGPVSSEGFRFSDPVDAFNGASTADMLRESIEFLSGFDCGVLIASHPFYFDMDARLAAIEAGAEDNPFIDPAACRARADGFAAALDERLARESAEATP